MRAAIYARVSTSDQRNEIQVNELTDYVNRRVWELAGVYQDQMSGAKAKRPGLDALMADARQRKIDVVIVMKLDRFGRSLMNCIAGIQELTAAGVRFIATSRGLGHGFGESDIAPAAPHPCCRRRVRARTNQGTRLSGTQARQDQRHAFRAPTPCV
jgi:DNA invertase Pin-like site-specific DNA recombinase